MREGSGYAFVGACVGGADKSSSTAVKWRVRTERSYETETGYWRCGQSEVTGVITPEKPPDLTSSVQSTF